MTDLEFATCDLDKLNEVLNNPNRKKFYQLKLGEPVYMVTIHLEQPSGLLRGIRAFNKYATLFYDIKLIEPNKPKSRMARIYVTTNDNTKNFYIDADKNTSAFIRYKYITKNGIQLQICGTTLEECVYKAEKITHINNLSDKLTWKDL